MLMTVPSCDARASLTSFNSEPLLYPLPLPDQLKKKPPGSSPMVGAWERGARSVHYYAANALH